MVLIRRRLGRGSVRLAARLGRTPRPPAAAAAGMGSRARQPRKETQLMTPVSGTSGRSGDCCNQHCNQDCHHDCNDQCPNVAFRPPRCLPSRRGRRRTGRDWRGWGRVGRVRIAERMHGGEQFPAFGVLPPQLLALFLDLLGFAPQPHDVALDLPRAPLARGDSQIFVDNLHLDIGEFALVIGIASPIQRRAQVARCMTHLRQPQAPAKQR